MKALGRNWVNDYGFDRSETYLLVCTHFCILLAGPVPMLAKLYQLFEYVVCNEIMLCRETSGWMRLNHMARMSIVYDVHMLFK